MSCWHFSLNMMMSSYRNIFRITGHLCGEFTGHRWTPPHKGQWRRALIFSFNCTWINSWVNNGEAGDLRCHRTHYDVIVMSTFIMSCLTRKYVFTVNIITCTYSICDHQDCVKLGYLQSQRWPNLWLLFVPDCARKRLTIKGIKLHFILVCHQSKVLQT